jgi:hypothetical protein
MGHSDRTLDSIMIVRSRSSGAMSVRAMTPAVPPTARRCQLS